MLGKVDLTAHAEILFTYSDGSTVRLDIPNASDVLLLPRLTNPMDTHPTAAALFNLWASPPGLTMTMRTREDSDTGTHYTVTTTLATQKEES